MGKTIIYLRTSTEDQNPENQKKDCVNLAEKLNLEYYESFSEKKSAFKDSVKRDVFENIKKLIEKGKIENLIVWDLDRIYRNRKKLVSFFTLCKNYNCKIYSFRQEWLESLNNIQEPFNEIIYNLMLQVMGWLAEDESIKKSKRIKIAVRKKNGITKSYRGNKWGRKTIITKGLVEKIKRLRKQGLNHREIAKKVYFYDKSNNKKNPSASLVYKLLGGDK